MEEILMSGLELEKVAKAWPSLSRTVRVPHTEGDYHALGELLDHLTGEVGQDEQHPLASLMDVVGVLIEKYEDEHVSELISIRHHITSERIFRTKSDDARKSLRRRR